MPRKVKTFTKGKTAGGKDDILNLGPLLAKQIMVMFMQKRIERSNRNLLTKSHSQVILPLPIKKCLLSVLNVLPWNGFRLYTHR